MKTDDERIAEPLTDAELRSWEATAPFGQVTIGAMELRRILAELRRLQAALSSERERCANIAKREVLATFDNEDDAERIATAIREGKS